MKENVHIISDCIFFFVINWKRIRHVILRGSAVNIRMNGMKITYIYTNWACVRVVTFRVLALWLCIPTSLLYLGKFYGSIHISLVALLCMFSSDSKRDPWKEMFSFGNIMKSHDWKSVECRANISIYLFLAKSSVKRSSAVLEGALSQCLLHLFGLGFGLFDESAVQKHSGTWK